MYTLYARPASGSVVVEAILEEAGASYRIETVERGPDGEFPESFKRLNPLAQVPTLVLPDGNVMTESGAIAIYLTDRCTHLGLAPCASDASRNRYLRWMFFLSANVYMSDLRLYYAQRYTSDPEGVPGVKAAAEAQMAREWDIFAASLGSGPYVLGEKLSTVDIYAAMLATWNLDVPAFFMRHPNIKAMYDHVVARPAIAKVWQRNGMLEAAAA